jgi:hypothetical protein
MGTVTLVGLVTIDGAIGVGVGMGLEPPSITQPVSGTANAKAHTDCKRYLWLNIYRRHYHESMKRDRRRADRAERKLSANGAAISQPRPKAWVRNVRVSKGLKARHKMSE